MAGNVYPTTWDSREEKFEERCLSNEQRLQAKLEAGDKLLAGNVAY